MLIKGTKTPVGEVPHLIQVIQVSMPAVAEPDTCFNTAAIQTHIFAHFVTDIHLFAGIQGWLVAEVNLI
jgi:hypothetical protein